MRINKQNLLCAMVRAEMNNQKLASRSGVSVTQISNIRQGRGSTIDTAAKLANALGVSVEELIERDSLEVNAGEGRP